MGFSKLMLTLPLTTENNTHVFIPGDDLTTEVRVLNTQRISTA